jgi:CheY-specific phosphatase CheX
MEKKNLLRAMKSSISEVLETMFFLPIDRTETVEAEEFNTALDTNVELVEVKFSGVFSGSFLLLIPDELALFLTASFLGSVEENVLPAHVGETKKEIVNMIAGNTFAHFNDQLVFDLGIPEVVAAGDFRKRPVSGEEVIYQSHTMEKHLFVRVSLLN